MKIIAIAASIFALTLLSGCSSTDEHGVNVSKGWFSATDSAETFSS